MLKELTPEKIAIALGNETVTFFGEKQRNWVRHTSGWFEIFWTRIWWRSIQREMAAFSPWAERRVTEYLCCNDNFDLSNLTIGLYRRNFERKRAHLVFLNHEAQPFDRIRR